MAWNCATSLDLVKNTEFKVFAGATAEGYSVRGINVKGAAATLTRKEIDKLTDFVKTYRAKGLAFTRFTADGVSSSFEKFLSEDEVKAIHERMGARDGDVLLITWPTRTRWYSIAWALCATTWPRCCTSTRISRLPVGDRLPAV